MRQIRIIGRLAITVALLLVLLPGATLAKGQWIMTEAIWDDGRPQPNEYVTWSGGHDNNGFASGPGVLQWNIDGKPANRYEGSLVKGKINGKGVAHFANGNRYEGDWVDGRRTGKGVFTWANGSRYEGDFIKDQRTGKGIMLYANGDRYEGDWVEGRRTGKGIMLYTNGDSYEGEWVNDQYSGNGIKTSADGRSLEGRWDAGGFLGPKPNNGPIFIVFLAIAAVACWVTGKTIQNGHLAWSQIMKYTGLFLICGFLAACLLNRDFVWQLVVNWDVTDAGINSPVYNFLTFGLVLLAMAGFRNGDRFSWRSGLSCSALYVFFTLVLIFEWGVYSAIFALFILGLGGH
jgi:hypothetical protein